jgi:hypothetical protein
MFSNLGLYDRWNASQLERRFWSATIGVLLCAFTFVPRAVIAKEWQGLVPLHSSRRDVETLLGAPLRVGRYSSSYDRKDEIAEIIFAKGSPCGESLVDSWRVPADTVISIKVTPKIPASFTPRAHYAKTKDPSQNHVSFYSDVVEGIRYTVEDREGREYVLTIDYLPRLADGYLKCTSFDNVDQSSIPVFEQYGNVSGATEKAILDNFAIQLIRHRELTGYVVLHVGQLNAKLAERRIKYIKSYLIKRRGVRSNRVVFSQEKRNRDFTVKLYLVPTGNTGPTSEPRALRPIK